MSEPNFQALLPLFHRLLPNVNTLNRISQLDFKAKTVTAIIKRTYLVEC